MVVKEEAIVVAVMTVVAVIVIIVAVPVVVIADLKETKVQDNLIKDVTA
jgi:hypothetical protein